MRTSIRVFAKKSLLDGYRQIGFLNLSQLDKLEFIIPSKGDIITLTEDLIRVWNSEYTNVPLKVHHIQYNYGCDEEGKTICDIIIFVKK